MTEEDWQAYQKRGSGFEMEPATVSLADAAAAASRGGWRVSRGGWRVIRGGAYDYSAHGARSAYRNAWDPGTVIRNLGFRVVLPRP